LYAYGLNNPVAFCDPTGHFPLILITALISMAFSLASELALDLIKDGEVNNSVMDYVEAGVVGFVSGLVSHGVGALCKGMNFFARVAIDAVASTATDKLIECVAFGETFDVKETLWDFGYNFGFGFICEGMSEILRPSFAEAEFNKITKGKQSGWDKTRALNENGVDFNLKCSSRNNGAAIKAVVDSFDKRASRVALRNFYEGLAGLWGEIVHEKVKKGFIK